jgi:hypothetical protein
MLAIVQSVNGKLIKDIAGGRRNLDAANIHSIMQECTCKPESYNDRVTCV